MSTPLDSLKDAFWLVRSHVEYSTDHLAGNSLLDEEHHLYDVLDSAVKAVTDALAAHVPGVKYDLFPRFTDEAWVAARTYDDGSPAIVTVDLDGGSVADYRPRLDGDFDEWKARFKPRLRALPAQEVTA